MVVVAVALTVGATKESVIMLFCRQCYENQRHTDNNSNNNGYGYGYGDDVMACVCQQSFVSVSLRNGDD